MYVSKNNEISKDLEWLDIAQAFSRQGEMGKYGVSGPIARRIYGRWGPKAQPKSVPNLYYERSTSRDARINNHLGGFMLWCIGQGMFYVPQLYPLGNNYFLARKTC